MDRDRYYPNEERSDEPIFGSDVGRVEEPSYPRPEEAKDPIQRWMLRRYYDGRSSDSPYRRYRPTRSESGLRSFLKRVAALVDKSRR